MEDLTQTKRNQVARKAGWIPVAALLFGAPFAGADELNSGDTAWMLTATALVLFMTIPGLALFYGGMVRSKNILSVLMQCFAITCLSTIIVVQSVAYSLAFGAGNGSGAADKMFLAGVPSRPCRARSRKRYS